MPIAHLTMSRSIRPYKSVPGPNGTKGTIPTTSILEISSGLVATSPCTSLLHLRLRNRYTKRTNRIEVVFESPDLESRYTETRSRSLRNDQRIWPILIVGYLTRSEERR